MPVNFRSYNWSLMGWVSCKFLGVEFVIGTHNWALAAEDIKVQILFSDVCITLGVLYSILFVPFFVLSYRCIFAILKLCNLLLLLVKLHCIYAFLSLCAKKKKKFPFNYIAVSQNLILLSNIRANLSFVVLAYADGVMQNALGMLQPRENLSQRLWSFRAEILHD